MILLPYIVKAQICFGVLWLLHRLLLQNAIRPALSRAYLWAMVAVSFLIPTLSIPVYPAMQLVYTPLEELPEIGGYEATLPSAINPLPLVLIAGALLVLLFKTFRFIQVLHTIRREKRRSGSIVFTTKTEGAFSAFGYIFINPGSVGEKELPQVIAHETAHIRLHHSVDLVLCELMQCALWWSPFVWLWGRSLREVHEYQADAHVLRCGFDPGTYTNLILNHATGTRFDLVSGFGYSLTKKRLAMISQMPRRRAQLRLLVTLPAIAALLPLFAFTHKQATPTPMAIVSQEIPVTIEVKQPSPASALKTEDAQKKNKPAESVKSDSLPVEIATPQTPEDPDEPLLVVENMPKFQDGNLAVFRRWVGVNIKYPRMAIEKNIEGRVTISFVIDRQGSLGNVAVVNSSGNAELDAEAVRVISSSPQWTPGTQGDKPVRVRFTMPVDFRLNKEPFIVVENMPKFQGEGLAAFRTWVADKIQSKEKTDSRATLTFIIEKDGSLTNTEIVRSSGNAEFDAEAVRIVSSSPKWTPGTQGGKPVRVKFNLPVDF